MARRTATTESATTTDEYSTPVEPTTEAPAEVEATETETPAAETTEAPTEVEVDFGPFNEAATVAVGQRDTSTGDLPDGSLEPVLVAYRALPDTKARNKAKRNLQDSMRDSLGKGDMSLAKAYLTLEDSMTTSTGSTGGAKREATPKDPTAQFKHNLLVSTLAYQELMRNVPEGVNVEEITAQASSTETLQSLDAWRAFLDTEVADGAEAPEAPEVPAEVIQAFRIVRGNKSRARVQAPGTGHDGPRRDLGAHIKAAFADVESGTFLSVADIRKHKSEEYGDDAPSAGAISARLFPSKGACTIEGIEPGTGGDKGNKGARKA